eukprot:3466407-Rhodomonas_salina.2
MSELEAATERVAHTRCWLERKVVGVAEDERHVQRLQLFTCQAFHLRTGASSREGCKIGGAGLPHWGQRFRDTG